MRICFDLDNTLVSSPKVPKDYRTVEPIYEIINLAKKLKEEGHTIIIYTARRMTTHGGNIGAVIKDIGKLTLETLDSFEIPYDEVIFGKPIADIYIDDKGFNPLMYDVSKLSMFNTSITMILNKLPNNKFNNIFLKDNNLVKTGPSDSLRGEYEAYKKIKETSILQSYFPTLYTYSESEAVATVELEYIKGIPYYYLYKLQLLNDEYLERLFDMLDIFHSISGNIDVSKEYIQKHYMDKLVQRFQDKDQYPFEDREEILRVLKEKLILYFTNGSIEIVPFIHGDFWFSNIILDFQNQVKTFDMRGKIGKLLTTSGDRLYDYAKLYQSILGYDFILNNEMIDKSYKQNIQQLFERKIEEKGISLSNLKTITAVLIAGTIYFSEDISVKKRIWVFLKDIL